MSHYKSNVRDQVFNLFEVLGVDKAFGEGTYSDLDVDTAKEMLAEVSEWRVLFKFRPIPSPG